MAQQVYTVTIPKQSTLFVEGTKAAINAKMKSLGISKYTISKKPLTKEVLSKVKSTSSRIIKPGSITKPVPKSSFQVGGRGPGGSNNPGMKPDLEAQSKRSDVIKKKKEEEKKKKDKTTSNKRISKGIGTNTSTKTKGGGSGTSTKKTNMPTLKADKTVPPKSKDVKSLTADKKESIVKKVKSKNKNVPKSRILSWIKNNPVKAGAAGAGGAGIVGLIIGALGYALTSTPVADATLNVTTSSKGPRPKSRITKPSSTSSKQDTKGGQKSSKPSVPISKPKREKKVSKDYVTKKNNGNKKQEKMYNLIAGGKGTAKQRLAEIDIEKVLEKKLGRRPDRKELLARLKKK